jgi:hypothetical protein
MRDGASGPGTSPLEKFTGGFERAPRKAACSRIPPFSAGATGESSLGAAGSWKASVPSRAGSESSRNDRKADDGLS